MSQVIKKIKEELISTKEFFFEIPEKESDIKSLRAYPTVNTGHKRFSFDFEDDLKAGVIPPDGSLGRYELGCTAHHSGYFKDYYFLEFTIQEEKEPPVWEWQWFHREWNFSGNIFASYGVTISDMRLLPDKSIALDGFHRGPDINTFRGVYSFDHHEGCVRHVTSASCVQVLDAILLGLNPEGYKFFINDIDGDTVMSLILLEEPALSLREDIQSLVRGIGMLDAHGPAYPLGSISAMVDNFYQVTGLGGLKRSPEYQGQEKPLIDFYNEAKERFMTWMEEGFPLKEEEGNPEFTITHEGNGFVMATGKGFLFGSLYAAGYTAAVCWQEQKDGSFAYTIGKKSEFVDFPVRVVINELNKVEPGWGGGSTIGGAPRNPDGSRSKIAPDKLFELVNQFI